MLSPLPPLGSLDELVGFFSEPVYMLAIASFLENSHKLSGYREADIVLIHSFFLLLVDQIRRMKQLE